MTQHDPEEETAAEPKPQGQQISVSTLITVATLLSFVFGSILGAYKFGDDRYVRKDEMVAVKKDLEYLKSGVERIERRQLGLEPQTGTSPLATRSPRHDD